MLKRHIVYLTAILLASTICSLLTPIGAEVTASQLIQSHGQVLPLGVQPGTEPLLHTNGTNLLDGFGNSVKLKGVQIDWNERVKQAGHLYLANAPSDSWFTLNDVNSIKGYGANCIELHENGVPDLMPTRDTVNEAYFTTWIDTWVNWCTQNQLYCIIDIRGFSSVNDSTFGNEISLSLPSWLWEGIYPTPTSKTQYDNIIDDFFNLSATQQNSNRQAFTDLWKYIANRYKDNPFVMFSIMNEPFCNVGTANADSNIGLAQDYSTYMEQIIDAMRSTGAEQPIFINNPYLWGTHWNMLAQIINRPNIVWVDHQYITGANSLSEWEANVTISVQKFVQQFNQPLWIGEYGFNPMSVIRTNYTNTWTTVLSNEVSFLDSLPLAGRQWHQYGYNYGEYLPYEDPVSSANLSANETANIMNIVCG